MEQRQPSVRVAMHADLDLHVVAAVAVRGDLKHEALDAHAVVMAHGALAVLAQDIVLAALKWTPDPGQVEK
jgi:hypothetical protein